MVGSKQTLLAFKKSMNHSILNLDWLKVFLLVLAWSTTQLQWYWWWQTMTSDSICRSGGMSYQEEGAVFYGFLRLVLDRPCQYCCGISLLFIPSQCYTAFYYIDHGKAQFKIFMERSVIWWLIWLLENLKKKVAKKGFLYSGLFWLPLLLNFENVI